MELNEASELSVPFGTEWYKCEFCTIGKRKGDWVFHFGGKLETKTPRFETYGDFRKLALANPEPSDLPNRKYAWERKPDDSVLEFLQNWGPLGIWHSRISAFFRDNDTDMVLYRQPGIGLRLMSLEDYWMQNHTRKLQPNDKRKMFNLGGRLEPGMVLDNYFETWRDIEFQLKGLQGLCDLYDEVKVQRELEYTPEEMVDQFNGLIGGTALRPYLIPRDDGKGYKWSFAFSSLYEALFILHGQNIIGEVDMRECANCHTPFDAISIRRDRFCSDKCMYAFPGTQKSSDEVYKTWHKLDERLNRREGVSKKMREEIRCALVDAKAESVEALEAVEEKYKDVLGKKRGSSK